MIYLQCLQVVPGDVAGIDCFPPSFPRLLVQHLLVQQLIVVPPMIISERGGGSSIDLGHDDTRPRGRTAEATMGDYSRIFHEEKGTRR